MKLEKWALVAEVVGAFAIVATLIVLILEIRVNTRELRTANTTAAVQFFNDWRTSIIESGEVAEIQLKGISGEELTGADRVRWQSLCENNFWSQILMYDRFIGSGDETRARGPLTAAREGIEQSTGVRECWQSVRESASRWGYDAFVDAVERTNGE